MIVFINSKSGGSNWQGQIYSDSDVYFLDDPFSVVDAHTAAILFYACVTAALAHKNRQSSDSSSGVSL